MRNKLVLGTLALSAATLIVGCFGHAGAYAEVDAPVVFVEEPTLVVVEPGIWVVRDYDYAVYYVDDYYWVYRSDRWHRSRTYDRGWVTVEVTIVPRVIVRRDHHVYVRYRGGPKAPTRRAPRQPGNDRDRPGPADDRRVLPPSRDQDKGPRPPGHSDDRHDAPPDRDRNKGPQPPDHSDPRDARPGHDDRPGVNPRDENKRERDERRTPDKDDRKRDDRKDRHDKR